MTLVDLPHSPSLQQTLTLIAILVMVLFCLFTGLVSGIETVVIRHNSFYTRFRTNHQIDQAVAFS